MRPFPHARRRFAACLALRFVLLASAATAQAHLRDGEIHDLDTRTWWHTTEALSNDGMQGRDTGSAAYQRAAESVAKRFEAAGLKPAGEHGTWFQVVPMHEVAIVPEGTNFAVTRPGGEALSLSFLQEITVTPNASTPATLEAPLSFRGYCGKEDVTGVAGQVVVCFGTQRAGLPGAGERAANARGAGALGIINVDDPFFSIEPPRWPYAYARSVTIQDPGAPVMAPQGKPLVAMRLSAEAFTKLVSGTGHDPKVLLEAGGHKQPLPNFEIPGKLHAELHTTQRDLSSPNVLAMLPGSDPQLKAEFLAVSAHLDGYGFGTPVNGDALYNGALDDAAYVALLIQTADDLRDGRQRHATEQVGINTGNYSGVTLAAPKRSLLFCVFTGEEKGLLGSNYFVQHPTVPLNQIAADINLDQLRPLFPLNILTSPGLGITTLGNTATEVGKGMGIELRDDREPERGLLRRADNFPFLRAGVPAIGFVFGFDPGTDAEKRYREWYGVRYHRPQDDLTQPMDFQAAAKFNAFFYRLVETLANAADKPRVLSPVH